MTLTLLAPAAAIVSALSLLAWSLQRVESEVAALRDSLRLSRAAAVASDELERDTRDVARQAEVLHRNARTRADLRRSRRRTARR